MQVESSTRVPTQFSWSGSGASSSIPSSVPGHFFVNPPQSVPSATSSVTIVEIPEGSYDIYTPPAPIQTLSERKEDQRRKRSETALAITRMMNQPARSSNFPWWPSNAEQSESESNQAYHVKTRLGANREGLLIDIGAHDNLTGDRWVERQSALAAQQGLHTQYRRLERPLRVEGVGKESQECFQQAVVPIAVMQGGMSHGTYTGTGVPNSDIPALLALGPLQKMSAIILTGTQQLILPGDGGVEIRVSPGSQVLELEPSPSGHLLLPCSEFDKLAKAGQRNTSSKAVSFLTGESTASTNQVFEWTPETPSGQVKGFRPKSPELNSQRSAGVGMASSSNPDSR